MTNVQAYEYGQALAVQYGINRDDCSTNSALRFISCEIPLDILMEVSDDDIKHLFFTSGLMGYYLPQIVVGERYGDIPADGKSWNYRDNEFERGVSMIRTADGDEAVSTREYIYADRPLIRCKGYKHYLHGSDGEPLLVGAVKIS